MERSRLEPVRKLSNMAETFVHVTIASLLAQGLIEQSETGIKLTEAGIHRAETLWSEISNDNKLLLSGYIGKIIKSGGIIKGDE